MSFATLKRNSSSVFEKLSQEVEKISNSSSSNVDDRFWKPEVDKAGNGYAVIRFLPSKEDGNLPWVKMYTHAFQGPGGWYIENCLSTINKSDPVMELNRQLWNTGRDSDKEIARKQKRKLSYYSNIYVVKDPAHPENEGKVFLYKYGKKIHDKILEAMQPAFADEVAVNPFDLWEGADFKLKIRKVDGYWNYDKSEFASTGTLGDFDDNQLEQIYNKIYDLSEFTADSNFKSYEELQKRLNMVLNSAPAVRIDRETYESEEEETIVEAPQTVVSRSTEVDDEDDTLSYFARLAEED
jgi:hypothetical protein